MTKLDMGAAWEDAVALLRAHPALTITIAALFIFLPTLAALWLGPPAFVPDPGASTQQMVDALWTHFQASVPWLFVQSLFSLFATVAILRLWLGRTGTSVGEALAFAARLFPTIFVLQLLLSIILSAGFLLFILPGAYLLGRLALTSPFVAHRDIYNPMKALAASWQATRENGWLIFLFLFLIFVAFMVISGVVGLVTGALTGLGAAGAMVSGAISAALAAAMGLVSTAVAAAIYRQLVPANHSEIFS